MVGPRVFQPRHIQLRSKTHTHRIPSIKLSEPHDRVRDPRLDLYTFDSIRDSFSFKCFTKQFKITGSLVMNKWLYK